MLRKYNNAIGAGNLPGDIIAGENILAGTDKNAMALIKRLNGVVLQNASLNSRTNTFLISGMGDRYNQFLFNGAVLGSYDPVGNSYPLELLPTEAIEEVDVQKTGNAGTPSGYSGGTVSLKTKDYTNRDFFYIKVGNGFNQETTGKIFYGDKKNDLDPLGFSGSQRNLPSAFPTTRSEFPFSARNLQEQVSLSKQLKNNLAPVSYGNSPPDENVLLGLGKKYQLKDGAKINLLAFINQNKSQLTDESTTQVSPNVSGNPYPFNQPDKVLIESQSMDENYRYSSQLSAIINASVIFW